FSFMGSGPLGALLSGLLVRQFGPQLALMISALIMATVVGGVGVFSSLWGSRARTPVGQV
ncbi:MAG: hypothetical protein O3A63_10265, partial [Proteobacteria bacterium]|nr:hypothetical protein [Pseudomonadota bacterium]